MLNQYKMCTNQMCQQKGWDKTNIQQVWLLFTEEVGELASAIRQRENLFRKTMKKSDGVDVQSELGDVFSYLFQISYMLNIDLDDMWNKHQEKIVNRKYSDII